MLPAFHLFRFTLIYLEDSSFLTIINIRAPGTFMFRAKYIYVLCKGFCAAKVEEEKWHIFLLQKASAMPTTRLRVSPSLMPFLLFLFCFRMKEVKSENFPIYKGFHVTHLYCYTCVFYTHGVIQC